MRLSAYVDRLVLGLQQSLQDLLIHFTYHFNLRQVRVPITGSELRREESNLRHKVMSLICYLYTTARY